MHPVNLLGVASTSENTEPHSPEMSEVRQKCGR